MTGRIGVAMSTHNRPTIRAQALTNWRQHLPDDIVFVLVDDASDPPADDTTHRFNTNVGVATVKNCGIELLLAEGVEHLFLTDDDCWPVTDDWWHPYTTAGIPHLMYLMRLQHKQTWTDGRTWAAKKPRGVLLYAHHTVIARAGGMRTTFPRWGNEHTEWSRRIHDIGLTPHPYMDVVGSHHIWHACDYDRAIPSTASTAERAATRQLRTDLMARYQGTTDHVPYISQPTH